MAIKLHLTEMPRPAGSISKHFRAALNRAKEYGQPFTVKQFAAWLQDAGATNVNTMSVGTSLKRFVAGPGGLPAKGDRPAAPRKPDDQHPLVVMKAFRRGKPGKGGVGGTYQWALGRPSSMLGAQKGDQTSASAFDDMELGPAGLSAQTPQHSPDQIAGDDEEDAGEFSGEPEEDEGEFFGSPDDGYEGEGEFSTEPEDDEEPEAEEEPAEEPEEDWIPQPDATGTHAESSMQDLDDRGYGPDNEIWRKIAQTNGDVQAGTIIRSTLPINLQRKAIVVAKQIFANLGKSWDGNPVESRLLSLYRLSEAPEGDEDIPSPEKRGNISVGRTMPNYGMDEAQLDPVDFAQLHGVKAKDRR